MPKKPKRPRDLNQLAHAIVKIATEGEPPGPADDRDPAAVALGQRGASKGGRMRAKSLSKSRRREIARKAAKSRWSKS